MVYQRRLQHIMRKGTSSHAKLAHTSCLSDKGGIIKSGNFKQAAGAQRFKRTELGNKSCRVQTLYNVNLLHH